MKNKRIVIAVVVLAVAIALMAGLFALTRPETVAGGKEITVTVVHKDGTEKAFSYSTDAEYLGDVIVAEGLVNGEEGPYGLYFDTVDGETASWDADQSYWSILIGEEYATVGADGIVLTDGGEYSLVYTFG
nr:hypothetical protein [Oscillospiraceae bacterium]